MKKIGKVFGFLLIVAISLSIVVFGYKAYQQKNYEQRLDSAKVTIKQESSRLNELNQAVNNLFTDDTADLLKPEVTTGEIEELKTEIDGIKVSAKSYQLKAQDLPQATPELINQQEDLLRRISQAYDKATYQEKIIALYQENQVNFQGVNDQAVINWTLSPDAITNLLAKVNNLPEGNWKNIALGYLNMAQDQYNQAMNTIDLINQLQQNGQLTPDANGEMLNQLLASLNNVTNANLADSLNQKVQEIQGQLQAAGKV